MQHERLGSRLGFILLCAGCAIGFGNVWRFPWLAGQYGGGLFVAFYIFFSVTFGLPIMVMEYAIGRAAQRSPVRVMHTLKPEKKVWRISEFCSFITPWLLMMFYTVIAGWVLYCIVEIFKGQLFGLSQEALALKYDNLLASPGTMMVYTFIPIALVFFVLAKDLSKGLEKINKWIMCALFILMTATALHSMTLKGAWDGITFFLKPDFSKMSWELVRMALTQSFFSLSIGMGALAIYGSYIGKDRALTGESINVIFLDLLVSILAGLIIFPSCLTYGVEPGAGPGLIFITLPPVFAHMTGGFFWGLIFFVALFFAGFSSILTVCEGIVAMVRDITGWNRKKLCWVIGPVMMLASVPCILGYNIWAPPQVTDVYVSDWEDFLSSSFFVPVGALVYVLFCTSRYGFTWDKFLAEANAGEGIKFPVWARGYCTYVLPVVLLVILGLGLGPLVQALH